MRLIILMLSMGSVVSFGYALAGYGVKFMGMGDVNWQYVIGGLASGGLCAFLAIFLWHRWMKFFFPDSGEQE